jgi:hypothetical protein
MLAIFTYGATATVSTPSGPQPIRDDRLLSASPVAACDDLARDGALPLGRALAALQPSALIPPPDRAAVQRATW